jgi:alpha-L-rhamnosidase
MKQQILLLFACIALLMPAATAQVSIGSLRTEQLTNPMGIDTPQPRLSWQLASGAHNVMQRAYHILVASSPQLLAQDKGDLWDSGEVESQQSHLIIYSGSPLTSNQRCYWKVRSITTAGTTPWSEPALWSMGLLGETAWAGRWIGHDAPFAWDSETTHSRLSARYLRKEFALQQGKEVKQATVHLSGLGWYELYLNGARVGDQVLAPAPTDYRRTVLYNSYDVTDLLRADNAIGVTLGNGRYYTMRQNYKPYKIPNFGYPKLRLNLIVEYTDGTRQTIASDTNWKLTADGPIRSNNEYDGEEYDARKELKGWNSVGYNDSTWLDAQRVALPYGTLRAAMLPPMRVVDKVTPVGLKKMGDRRYILDMGQNMVGWLRIKVQGHAGDTLRLRFAETLQADGELFTRNLRDARATDTYVVRGDEVGSSWAPRFTYHGFRYVELTGFDRPTPADFTGEVVNDDLATIGTFETSNPLLNQLHRNAFWGIRSNYKGMPVDCPQRNERQPWLGDHAIVALGESFIFNNGTFYAKWMDDIREAQREDGCVPDVAPAFWNYYTDDVTWPATWLVATDMLYHQFGDRRPIEKNYAAMRRWMDHILQTYQNAEGLITKDKYGDWCVPPEKPEMIHSQDPARKTDGTLIATAYTYKMLEYLTTGFGTVTAKEAAADPYQQQRARIQEAFNKRFLHVKGGTSRVPGHPLFPDSIYYDNNTVTANLLPLAFGLVPKEYEEAVAQNIIATIIGTNGGKISTGVIGTQWLLRQLSRMGRSDVAYLLAANTGYPSWGYMLKKGATTIWELWNGDTANPSMNSGNHVMLLGDLIPWFYENLGGIRAGSPGFQHLILKPDFDIQELSHAAVTYQTPYGKVSSRWTKTPTHVEWDVEVPANTTAEVHLPDGKTERIGSGQYHYSAAIPTRSKAVLLDEFLYEQTSFPECHASTLAETPEGDLVAAFFGGTKERNPDCCIWVCRKEKGSDRWTAPMMAADGVFSPTFRKACWNPVLFQMPDGELLLFYKIGLKVSDWSGWLVRSRDGGRTWSRREPLPEGFLGPVKNKPVLINGRLICPSSTEGDGGWRVHFELSDDHGKTWRMVGPIAADAAQTTAPSERTTVQAIQPSILIHKDGRLQVLCRSRNGKLATAWSSDNGESWTPLSLSSLPNNNSGTDALTLRDGRQLLVYNNFGTLPGTPKGPRTPLNIALSKDGVQWHEVLTLEDSPISQYSYPAVIQTADGKVHVLYTWRRQRIKHQVIDPKLLK